MTTPDRLSVLDELFLHLEGPNTHMHVGGIALFEGPPPELQDLLDAVGSRLHLVPRFRQKLATVPYGLGRPVWVDDPHFNLARHLTLSVLAPPGDGAALKELVAAIMSEQLDRARPLWEMRLVTGLADGRFAVISKTHHCVVDGISSTDIMSVLLDPSRPGRAIDAQPWLPAEEPTSERLIADALAEGLTSPGELWKTVQSALLDRQNLPGKIADGARALAAFVGGTLDFAPESSLNQPIGPGRRFETVLVELDVLKQIKNRFGGTVNDVVLSVVTGGLARLLLARGESIDDLELRALIPVSVRRQGQGRTGNQLAALWAGLPVSQDDPVERLREVAGHMKKLKSSGQSVGAQLLTKIGEYAPSTVLAQAARVVPRQRAFNLVVTNVPGPQIPLYLMGRQMQEVYPVLPLSDNTTLGVALLSYNRTVGFGLLGDRDTAPDLAVLAEGIEKAIAELSAAI